MNAHLSTDQPNAEVREPLPLKPTITCGICGKWTDLDAAIRTMPENTFRCGHCGTQVQRRPFRDQYGLHIHLYVKKTTDLTYKRWVKGQAA